MDEQSVINKVNELLEETDYPLEVTDLSDIEAFLSNESNTNLDIYEEIENLYTQLIEDYEFES